MSKYGRLHKFTFSLLSLLIAVTVSAEDWPQWRGPRANGVSLESNVPVTWSESSRLLWKTELIEWGNSTPAIMKDSIFLTSEDAGRLMLCKYEKSTGKLVWSQEVGRGTLKREGEKREEKFHRIHNLSSPSPVTDGEVVIAHFGSGDLAAYDFAGKQLWHRNLAKEHGLYTIWWGHANSPILYENLVISVCMQDDQEGVSEKLTESYVIAHDKKTGKEVWKRLRKTDASGEQFDSYTTPLLYPTADRTELIIMGGNQLDSYDPKTGEQLWYLEGLRGGRTVTGPTISEDVLYTTAGQRGPMYAVKLGNLSGELSQREHVLWKQTVSTPDSCSPVVSNNLVFTIVDNGIVVCTDIFTGKVKWKNRIRGDFKASPIAAEDRIYFLSTDGTMTVISAGSRFEVLATNKLEDTTVASPAISNGVLYIRGKKYLYAIGNK